MKSINKSASDSNMSPSLYLSVVSSSKVETLNKAPDVRPLMSSPGNNPSVVVPIPTLPTLSILVS